MHNGKDFKLQYKQCCKTDVSIREWCNITWWAGNVTCKDEDYLYFKINAQVKYDKTIMMTNEKEIKDKCKSSIMLTIYNMPQERELDR